MTRREVFRQQPHHRRVNYRWRPHSARNYSRRLRQRQRGGNADQLEANQRFVESGIRASNLIQALTQIEYALRHCKAKITQQRNNPDRNVLRVLDTIRERLEKELDEVNNRLSSLYPYEGYWIDLWKQSREKFSGIGFLGWRWIWDNL